MKVTVLAMVVAVLVSSTVEYGEANASVEICEQIRSNQLDILTMGARGKSLDDAHFYILAKGGYMFKVPLANLRVDENRAENRTTSITIDREYIRADALFNVSRDLFTRQNRFFFISNQNQDAFLCRMFLNYPHSEYQLYDLNGALSKRHHLKDIDLFAHGKYVMTSIGIDSNTAYGCSLSSNELYWHNTFEADNKDKLKMTQTPIFSKFMMELSGTTVIVTAFYHQMNPKIGDGYYYFLDANGLVTVSHRKSPWDIPTTEIKDVYRDRFEVNLSSFVVCHFKSTTTNPQTTDPPTSDWTYWTIMALCLGTIFVLGGLAIYFYVAMRKEKVKRRDLKKKNRKNKSNLSSLASSNLNSSSISSGTSSSNVSSNAFTLTSNPTTSSTSMASKGSSVLQSIKSGISSLLSRNKSKQAKTVVKAKNSKAKEKKPKSPK